jgi:hypothetical protein
MTCHPTCHASRISYFCIDDKKIWIRSTLHSRLQEIIFVHATPNGTELPFHSLGNTDMMEVFHLSTSYWKISRNICNKLD